MKIDWNTVVTIIIALVVVMLLNKFVMSKIGATASYDEDESLEEDESYDSPLTY